MTGWRVHGRFQRGVVITGGIVAAWNGVTAWDAARIAYHGVEQPAIAERILNGLEGLGTAFGDAAAATAGDALLASGLPGALLGDLAGGAARRYFASPRPGAVDAPA